MSGGASKKLLKSIVEMDVGLAEGLLASLTAADRWVALMDNQGVEPHKLAPAKAGLAAAREAAKALERDAHLLARAKIGK